MARFLEDLDLLISKYWCVWSKQTYVNQVVEKLNKSPNPSSWVF